MTRFIEASPPYYPAFPPICFFSSTRQLSLLYSIYPDRTMHTDNNRCVSFVTKKEKMTRNTRYAASRGSSSSKNETTRTGRIHRKRRCCCILATTIRRAPPFLSFFLHPLFSSFFSILHRYALPQQPSSLWGTHYRCFFHVISKPHTPFRATLHTRRLSICGPTWIVYFLSFFALFVSFFLFFCFLNPFNSLSICFATCRNIVGLFRIFDLR